MRRLASVLVAVIGCTATWASASQPQDAPVFRAGVDRVTVAATVKTRRGRPVLGLQPEDFQLFDNGVRRPITDFRSDAGPVSLALLVDFSGSMGVAARRQATHDAAYHLISTLTPGVDQAGLYVFDSRLRELQSLAPAPGDILSQLDAVSRPFGATSLFDAIAETGRVLATVGSPRRAVVAITDGADNWSRLSAEQVSGIASSIDVPVYIMVVVSPFDRFGRSTVDDPRLVDAAMSGPLANLAHWTGGEIHVGVGPLQTGQAAKQIVAELRQQYLIAFEPGRQTGWHPIELRMRDKDLVVRARSGYVVQGPREGL
ncbi:MAG: VWA domain-containing protein [Acidobacteria bacterium]|nr:VWA domain-containing protein [Acidobacteriota bacterium]